MGIQEKYSSTIKVYVQVEIYLSSFDIGKYQEILDWVHVVFKILDWVYAVFKILDWVNVVFKIHPYPIQNVAFFNISISFATQLGQKGSFSTVLHQTVKTDCQKKHIWEKFQINENATTMFDQISHTIFMGGIQSQGFSLQVRYSGLLITTAAAAGGIMLHNCWTGCG